MTVTEQKTGSAQVVLDAVRDMAPTIEERATEIEAARSVPPDLLDQLAGAGCFRLLRPPSHGGIGAPWPDAMRIFETLAEADGSVAWIVGIGGAGFRDLAGLPRDTFDTVFGDPDVVTAGVFNPSGTVEQVDGGYRVSGRWSFASGCEHATWIYGNCVEGFADGAPVMRMAVFTPDEIVIEDTWHVIGLRGTGSHHFHVDDVVIPAERTLAPLTDPPAIDEPIVRVPPPSIFSLGVASLILGVARAAIDDVVDLAAGKVPLLAGSTLATNPHFHHELAVADTRLRSARALVYEVADELWSAAVEGTPLPLDLRARVRAAGAWAASSAEAAVDTAYRAAGSSTVYDDSPLQRRWRDVHAMTQHFLVKGDTLTTAGSVFAGQELQVPIF